MFFKFYKDGRDKIVDMTDLYLGESCFIVAGSPAIKEEPIERLKDFPGVFLFGINNSPLTIRPNFWIGGDRPECYAPRILKDTGILKFANFHKRDFIFEGIPWKFHPSTLFYPCTGKIPWTHYLEPLSKLSWRASTWWLAIQLCYRLGFRTLYLLGAEFSIQKGREYSWKTKLMPKELQANIRLYAQEAKMMTSLELYFKTHGLRIINCCRTSAIAETYGYTPLAHVLEEIKSKMPEVDSTLLPHSKRKAKK